MRSTFRYSEVPGCLHWIAVVFGPLHRYVTLVLTSQPQTPSLHFHLPKVEGLTLHKVPPWCRHAGIPLAGRQAGRLHCKPWCRPRPLLHDSLRGPASVTCQAVRCFLCFFLNKTEGRAIAQCFPILSTGAVTHVHNQTTRAKAGLTSKYSLTIKDHRI